MCNFIALFRWLPLLLSSRGLFGVLGTKTSFLSFLEPVLNRSQELQTKTNTSNRTRKKSICINQKLMILLDFSLKMLFFSKKLFLNVRFGIFVFVFSSWDLFFWKLDFPKSSKMRFSLPNSPNPPRVPPHGHSCNGYWQWLLHIRENGPLQWFVLQPRTCLAPPRQTSGCPSTRKSVCCVVTNRLDFVLL